MVTSLVALTTILDIVEKFTTFVDKLLPASIIPVIIQLCATVVMFIVVAKFVFKPVREILRKRQDYITSQITEAEASKVNSKAYEQLAYESIAKAKEESKVIIAEAKAEAEANKEKAMADLDEQLKANRQRAEEEIKQEKEAAKEEIRNEIINVALQASEAVLKREINELDNSRLVEDFVKDVSK